VTTIVRAPIAWQKTTGQGVKVAVIQNHQENLDLVTLVAPGAQVVPWLANRQFEINGKSPEKALGEQNIRLLVILQPDDFDPQVLRGAINALGHANVTVFLNVDLATGKDSIELGNDLEASGAITVGQLNMSAAVLGSAISLRKINLFAPYGLSAETGNAALTVAGVGALVLANEPAISAEMIKKRLVETADRMWQASDLTTGQWEPQNINVDPVSGDYTPNGDVFRFNRVNAGAALGQTLDQPWPVHALNAPAAWKKATGRGVKVAVIDQGFHVDNPAFKDHLVEKAAFVPGKDFNGAQNFHGTSMAKIVLSVAPDASLVFLLTNEGGTSEAITATVKAIDYAIAHDIDVITSSAGPWQNTPDVHAAIDRATQAGIVFVWFHYRGTNPAVIRPGYYWDSSWDVGAFDRFFDPDKPSDLEGGLSDTAPQIAGIAALVLQNEPHLSPLEMRQRIIETAAVLPNGCSLADAAAAVENRPSGRKIPAQPNPSTARGKVEILYSLAGQTEKKTLLIRNFGTKTPLPILPQRNVFIYQHHTNQSGKLPINFLGASKDDLFIGMGFYSAQVLASGEAKPTYIDLILEQGDRSRVDLTAPGTSPIKVEVTGNDLHLHWANPDGVAVMKMDSQTGKYTVPAGVTLYQLDAEGDFLPLVNLFQSSY
jgi:hypothetical protein